ncbi:hypothetical protein TNCV_2230751 [Trichonephila clavipes]|uniref:Uncharacterized protein n=1 Tax=Trichonephila clavipes TaxID=2585209 RepID=A0A8X6WFA7_TRICX|nr:hypothetical protein TNCV_2230751 [Trichonephila clavipes]
MFEDEAVISRTRQRCLGKFCSGDFSLKEEPRSGGRPSDVSDEMLRRKRFDDIPYIQQTVTRLLNSIPKDDFLQSFQHMYSRSQLCIVMRGGYFEGQDEKSLERLEMSTSDRKFLLSKHQPNAERVLAGETTIFHRDQLSNRYRTDFESCAATVLLLLKKQTQQLSSSSL